ncbi:hypothetical protein FHT00_000839 [Sphingomonas insulae]|nr:hypothetical protein [Sphingomonas insulae]
MGGIADWLSARGFRPQALRDRALAGVGIGLLVVMIDRVLGFGS